MSRCMALPAASLRVFALAAAAAMPFTLGIAFTAAPATASAQASAQPMTRHFHANALRGRIAFLTPPAIELNGNPQRLAPGSRIRGQDNMLLMSAAIVGQKALVNYTLDQLGQVQDVWILSDAERDNRPWPTTLQEQRTWTFDEMAQKWSKP